MARLEIRQYAGDFEDVVEHARQVWIGEYAGKTWAPLPDAAFLREKFAQTTGAVCLVAHEGTKLVGSVLSLPRTMRFHGEHHAIAMCTGFTVEPANRRVALPLTEKLRRINEEHGASASIGLVLDDPTSPSFRFWMKYAEAYPKSFRIVSKFGFLAKFLRPENIARAGIERWERIASRTVGPLLRQAPFGYDAHVRPYVASDLPRCLEMSVKTSAGMDWAMCWTAEQLEAQLGGSYATSLVYERDGQVQALVNCHSFIMQGRETVRCAIVDVWAEDGITGFGRARLISHLCKHLREIGIDSVVAPRSAAMPVGALTANLFMPASRGFYIGMFPTDRTRAVAAPQRWSFEIV